MQEESERNIGIAFILNLAFSLIELFGGIVTNSYSIISDSFHDFMDCISILIAFILEKKSGARPDLRYSYGYQKFSVLGATINSLILSAGSIIVGYGAAVRFFNPERVDYDGVLILSLLGLIVNGIGAYKTINGKKLNERAVGLHLLEDVLGWVAVLISGILMKIFDLTFFDPLIALCISIFILYNALNNIFKISDIFLDRVPRQIDIEEVEKKLLERKEILQLHHIHIWTDGTNNFMTVHIKINVDSPDDIIDIKNYVRKKLLEFNINHVTMEFEFENEECDLCNIGSLPDFHSHSHTHFHSHNH